VGTRLMKFHSSQLMRCVALVVFAALLTVIGARAARASYFQTDKVFWDDFTTTVSQLHPP
jgi:hypothetical protein